MFHTEEFKVSIRTIPFIVQFQSIVLEEKWIWPVNQVVNHVYDFYVLAILETSTHSKIVTEKFKRIDKLSKQSSGTFNASPLPMDKLASAFWTPIWDVLLTFSDVYTFQSVCRQSGGGRSPHSFDQYHWQIDTFYLTRTLLLVIYDDQDWGLVRTCSLDDPPPADIWWLLKHEQSASVRYASYWNVFLLLIAVG